MDRFKEFARGDVYMKIGGNAYSAKGIVGFTGNDMVLYDVVDNVPFEGQMVIALNGDKAMFYDIVGVKEKEAAQLNRSEPAGVESTSSTNSISQNAKKVNPESQNGRKYALPETEQSAVDMFGHTYSWSETGYILTDGSRLDFSGRHEGGRGGYRSVDHLTDKLQLVFIL